MTSFSIITPVLNSAATIRDCLKSIHGQDIPSEHIVIDGSSTDGTLRILDEYRSTIASRVSEPDRGIYEAMNKGILAATGDVVGILNADDVYAHGSVLSRVAQVFEDERVESCYGDLVYLSVEDVARVVRFWRAGPYDARRFYWGWMPPHPTFFVRRSVYEKYGGFRVANGSAADYELMLRFLLKHRISTVYIPEVLVKMRSGGISNVSLRNRLKANRMDRHAWRVNGLRPWPWTIPLKPLSKIGQFLVRG